VSVGETASSGSLGALEYETAIAGVPEGRVAVERSGDDIYILYQGSVAEKGDTVSVIENPKHPYVQLLIDSIPVPDPNQKWDTNVTLPSEEELRGQVETGCRFYPRCPYHMDRCLVKQPPLYEIDSGTHRAACYLYDQSPTEAQSGGMEQQEESGAG